MKMLITDVTTEKIELSAKEIFDKIVKGEKVKFPLGVSSSEEYHMQFDQFQKLFSHLNVIKSRAKTLYSDLQLDWDNFILYREIKYDDITQEQYVIISSIKGEPLRKKFRVSLLD